MNVIKSFKNFFGKSENVNRMTNDEILSFLKECLSDVGDICTWVIVDRANVFGLKKLFTKYWFV